VILSILSRVDGKGTTTLLVMDNRRWVAALPIALSKLRLHCLEES
jgi:hypothetical protein